MQQTNSQLGLGVVLIVVFMAPGYMLIGRKLSGKIDTIRNTAIIYSIAAIFLILIVIFRGDEFFAYSNWVWGLSIALAIVLQILAHSLLNYSL